MKNCVIVIPVLDPEESFFEYVKSLVSEEFLSVIIINDGSSEESAELFTQCAGLKSVRLLQHVVNQGKGRALKTAFDYILKNEELSQAEGVITVDADGQHRLNDVIHICEELRSRQETLILGSRSFSGSQVPFKSRLGNTLTSKVFQLFYNRKLKDTQTGLRGLTLDILQYFVSLEGERFSYETNMLIEAVRKKMTISECTIETIYINDNQGTHFRPLKDSLEIYWLLVKNFVAFMSVSLSSFLIDISLFQVFILLLGILPSSRRILLATIIARAGSSLYNYLMNRSIVFKSKQSFKQTLFFYYALVAVEALVSAYGVSLLFGLTGLRELYLKILTDACIFFVSYRIQKFLIFRD
ncbi:dolichyl-phosphate mannose synthase [Alkalibacterium sp. AK22]|uniref:bifunctional glycosyltransferase family 2/GtrA family protein n=1 Tax=Alkalibacterium sp. AK22 TaxID=1229520 RepID=UPI000450C396|nr:bifunctional glycosyltransferase family 2/GtrA family protein [Alkalibacterium sp. AK22]EXJ23732.1 dolichyl-phosphate mannose synthase [Alkalibacterium sp. AK22]